MAPPILYAMRTLRRQQEAVRRSLARILAPCAALAVVAAFVAAPTLFAERAVAQSRYTEWQPPASQANSELTQFIEQLKTLLKEATASRAADPVFLKDVEDLIASYENPWSTQLFFDDFSDGNFTANPKWTVSAGDWIIDRQGTHRGLRSHIVPEGQTTGQNITIGNIVIGTIGSGQTGAGGYASIYTPVRISNAFRIEMAITSKHKYGRWDFGPYQGSSGKVAYRLTYFPNATPGLQLSRVTSQGTTVIATYNQPLRLETESDHALVWTRDRNGLMHVAIDGKPLIQVTDTGIRDPFDGFLMINSGGQYSVRSIRIMGRPVP